MVHFCAAAIFYVDLLN